MKNQKGFDNDNHRRWRAQKLHRILVPAKATNPRRGKGKTKSLSPWNFADEDDNVAKTPPFLI